MDSTLTCIVAIRLAALFPERNGAHAPVSLEAIKARIVLSAENHGGYPLEADCAGRDSAEPVLVFPEVDRALRFALEVSEGDFHESDGKAFLHIGVHGVSVGPNDDAVKGEDIALAQCLADRAPAGGVVVSREVGTHATPDIPVRFFDHGWVEHSAHGAAIESLRVEREWGTPEGQVIRFGAFELDTSRFELRREGALIPVEPRTFDLIALLARNIDRTVTKDEIFQTIWEGRAVSDAALSSQVRSARRALGDDGLNQSIIATVHGRGFRLRSDAQDARSSAQRPATGEPLALPQTDTPRPTVAVLPCANLDEDGRGAILAQGLTEDLINALSKNRWLRVITRSPAFALSRATDDISVIAQKLGADYLITGSIRRAGSRVRTTMQATDTRTMRCIWSEGFDREMRDIFELQEEISGLVSSRIATELGIEEQKKAARVPHANLGAWELYQLGSAEFYRFTPESNRRCQELMRQAIREDPAFADPHSRLAYAMILEMVYFEGPIDAGRMDEAVRLAEQGVALDDQDANTFFSLGRVRLARREYNLAIDALEHAITLNPCHALSHCGLGDSLAYEERFDEALHQFDHAIALSPHDPFRWAFMSYRSLAHLFAGQFKESALWARRASQVPNAHYWARAHLVSALGHLGDAEQASTDSNLLLKTRPGFSRNFAEERLFFVKKRNQLETFLEGLGRAGIP